MQGRHRDPAARQLAGEIDGEDDLGELALAIGAPAVIALCQHHIGEIEGLLAEGGHIDDTRRRAFLEEGEQQMGQQEAREIIDGEAQLMPVAAGASLIAPGAAAQPGIVDQDMQARMVPR